MSLTTPLRLCLLAPPLLLCAGSLAVLAASPGAWGAASDAGIPAWMTTASGVAFGVSGLLVGALCLRETLRRTRNQFSVGLLQLWFGALLLVIALVLEFALALRIADPTTYDSLRSNRPEDQTSPSGFFFVSLMGTVVLAGVIAGGAYLYDQAITVERRSRFERSQREIDSFESLLGPPRRRR